MKKYDAICLLKKIGTTKENFEQMPKEEIVEKIYKELNTYSLQTANDLYKEIKESVHKEVDIKEALTDFSNKVEAADKNAYDIEFIYDMLDAVIELLQDLGYEIDKDISKRLWRTLGEMKIICEKYESKKNALN